MAHLVTAQESEPPVSACPVALPALPKCGLQMPSLSFEAPSLSPLCDNVCELIEGCTDTLAKIVTPAHENFGDVPVASYQFCVSQRVGKQLIPQMCQTHRDGRLSKKDVLTRTSAP